MAAITNLFAVAANHFVHGEKTEAKMVYSGLFDIIDELEYSTLLQLCVMCESVLLFKAISLYLNILFQGDLLDE